MRARLATNDLWITDGGACILRKRDDPRSFSRPRRAVTRSGGRLGGVRREWSIGSGRGIAVLVAHEREYSLGIRLTGAAVLAMLLLIPFALLAVLIVGDVDWLHDLDERVADGLHAFAAGHAGWVRFMSVWSVVFDPNSWRAAAVLLAIWLIRWRGSVRLALWVIVTMTAGGVLGAVLKLLVGRHRPDFLDPVARASGYSFPSGHALNNALGAAVFLLVLLPLTRRRLGLRIALWTGAIGIPLVTGLSRIGLGVHWTSDVVAGWLLGVAVVAATATAFLARGGRRGGRPHVATEGLEPGIAQQAAQEA
jgi:undecaprenyl-diphosphatase